MTFAGRRDDASFIVWRLFRKGGCVSCPRNKYKINKMPALLFDTCCGCIDLRTGSLIIGYLQLVSEIIFGIFLLVTLTVGSVGASGALHVDSTSMDRNDLPREFNIDNNTIVALSLIIVIVCVILLLALVLALAFTITLLVGVHNNKRGHVKAYLIYTTIFMVLAIIMFFVSLSSKKDAGSVVGNLISFALNIYFMLVIRSHYYKMDTNKPTVFNTA